MEIERRCPQRAMMAERGEGEGERESERDRQARKKYRGEKETRYILYDSVIAFPRTNIAPAERTQENVDVNRRPLLLSTFFLCHPIPPPCFLSSFFTASKFLWEKTFVKYSPPLFASRCCDLFLANALFDSPNPAKSSSSRSLRDN